MLENTDGISASVMTNPMTTMTRTSGRRPPPERGRRGRRRREPVLSDPPTGRVGAAPSESISSESSGDRGWSLIVRPLLFL